MYTIRFLSNCNWFVHHLPVWYQMYVVFHHKLRGQVRFVFPASHCFSGNNKWSPGDPLWCLFLPDLHCFLHMYIHINPDFLTYTQNSLVHILSRVPYQALLFRSRLRFAAYNEWLRYSTPVLPSDCQPEFSQCPHLWSFLPVCPRKPDQLPQEVWQKGTLWQHPDHTSYWVAERYMFLLFHIWLYGLLQ